MRTGFDIIISIFLTIFSIMIFAYEMLISSDIPVSISAREFEACVFSLLIFLISFTFYCRYSKKLFVGFILLIPFYLWLVTMIDALKYNYENNHTFLSILGFTINLICLLQVVYKVFKKKSKEVGWDGKIQN